MTGCYILTEKGIVQELVVGNTKEGKEIRGIVVFLHRQDAEKMKRYVSKRFASKKVSIAMVGSAEVIVDGKNVRETLGVHLITQKIEKGYSAIALYKTWSDNGPVFAPIIKQ